MQPFDSYKAHNVALCSRRLSI
ncbi:unnamed protein product [Phytomonas sp. EM1]|nr:unnamed protein product [Phytomonas sp. EM1]|eukprot:CCW60643.1 unnamed protein product [Phytomonas sp. isolate EM1]